MQENAEIWSAFL